MKAAKADYENLKKCIESLGEFKNHSETNLSVTRYIWEIIYASKFTAIYREIYTRLNDDNIEVLAKKVLKDLGKI